MAIITRMCGGLGNQLFQYTLGRFLADKNHTDLIIDNSYYQQTNHYHPYCVDRFNIRHTIPHKDHKFDVQAYKETSMSFNPDVMDLKDNTYLVGYWQNYNYVVPLREELRKELIPLEIDHPQVQEMKNIILSEKNTPVVLGFRGTDFLRWRKFNVVDKEYYREALQKVSDIYGDNITLYIVTDDPEGAKATLRDILPKVPMRLIHMAPHIDIYLMSLCKVFIIPNSTFHWWGAFLSDAEDKLIIAPSRWWTEAPDLTADERMRNLITPEMTLINN